MANIMSDLFREIEKRIDGRRKVRQPVPPLRFPGEKREPRLPSWPAAAPHVPASDYRLRASQL